MMINKNAPTKTSNPHGTSPKRPAAHPKKNTKKPGGLA